MINETERIKKLMGISVINEINIDDSGITVEGGNLVYIDDGGNRTTYSVSVNNMFTDSKLHIIDFNISENSFTYLKGGEKVTKDISDEKIKNIIQNMRGGVDSFEINGTIYDIKFNKVK